MSFLDKLESDKRKREAEQRQLDEARQREAERRREEQRREAEHQAQRHKESQRLYAQALSYYEESPCRRYIEGIVERIPHDQTFLREYVHMINGRRDMRLDSSSRTFKPVILTSAAGVTISGPRKGTYSGEVVVDASIVWRTVSGTSEGKDEDAFAFWPVYYTNYAVWALQIFVDASGTITVGDDSIPLDEWRRDRGALDDAFRKAWNRACSAQPGQQQESKIGKRFNFSNYNGIGD